VTDPRPHWDEVYRTRAFTEVSWYQANPARSIALIEAAAPDHADPIIDIGCGAGVLLGELARRDYRDLGGASWAKLPISCRKH